MGSEWDEVVLAWYRYKFLHEIFTRIRDTQKKKKKENFKKVFFLSIFYHCEYSMNKFIHIPS